MTDRRVPVLLSKGGGHHPLQLMDAMWESHGHKMVPVLEGKSDTHIFSMKSLLFYN